MKKLGTVVLVVAIAVLFGSLTFYYSDQLASSGATKLLKKAKVTKSNSNSSAGNSSSADRQEFYGKINASTKADLSICDERDTDECVHYIKVTSDLPDFDKKGAIVDCYVKKDGYLVDGKPSWKNDDCTISADGNLYIDFAYSEDGVTKISTSAYRVFVQR